MKADVPSQLKLNAQSRRARVGKYADTISVKYTLLGLLVCKVIHPHDCLHD